MNVLIITHAYAPDASPRAFRWTAIAEHWAREGAVVQVITTGRRGGAAVEQRNGVAIHHTGETTMGRVQRRVGVTGASASRDQPSARTSSRAFVRMLRTVYDATWRRVFWPDYACLWYRPALALAKRLCRTSRFDAVITVSHPFTGHLIGLSLKRAFPGLRWIADIGDPFSLKDTVASNNLALYHRLNRRIEAAVLQECDVVSVTVEGCRMVLADEFAVDPAKIHVIPPLLSLPETAADDGSASEYASAETIDLVYLGVLYATIRPPDGLLALFAAMHARQRNLRLHFFGDVQGCESAFEHHRELLDKAILLHGPIPRAKVAPVMAAANVLVNIGNGTAHQLPSKLVEYFVAGKPILNVTRSRPDTAADFLHSHPAAMSVTLTNDVPTKEHIESALTFVRNPPAILATEIDRLAAPFRISAIADALTSLVLKSRHDTSSKLDGALRPCARLRQNAGRDP